MGKIRDCMPDTDIDGNPVTCADLPVFPATVLIDDINKMMWRVGGGHSRSMYFGTGYPESHHV